MTSQSSQAFDMSRMFEASPVDMASMAKFYASLSKVMSEMNTETFRFFSARLGQDFDLPVQLAKCKTPEEFSRIQMAFFEKMTTDYRNEAQKIFQMAMAAAEKVKAENISEKNGKAKRKTAPADEED